MKTEGLRYKVRVRVQLSQAKLLRFLEFREVIGRSPLFFDSETSGWEQRHEMRGGLTIGGGSRVFQVQVTTCTRIGTFIGLHVLLVVVDVDVLPSSSVTRLFKISDELKVTKGTKSDFITFHFQFQKLSLNLPLVTKVSLSTMHGVGKTRKAQGQYPSSQSIHPSLSIMSVVFKWYFLGFLHKVLFRSMM